jgi:hypothetical protein
MDFGKMTNDHDQLKELKEINSKMDVLIKLTAIQALGSKKKVESVGILTDLGFTEGEIANLLNTTSGSVHSMRKYNRKKSSQVKKTAGRSVKNPAPSNLSTK